MTSLSSKALRADSQGLAFLRAVLCRTPSPDAFGRSVGDPQQRSHPVAARTETAIPRRVSEAAGVGIDGTSTENGSASQCPERRRARFAQAGA